MHEIEPFYNWRDQYTAENDSMSPFFERTYNEFAYDKKIYNYYIHPQWDSIESEGLYVKILFVDYDLSYAIIELFGEWNDAIDNDIMLLQQEVIQPLLSNGIAKYVLIGENILNFHGSDDTYYQEWADQVEDDYGWIIGLNFREHVIDEMSQYNIPQFIQLRAPFNQVKWRPYKPEILYHTLEQLFGDWLEEGLLKLG